MKITDPDVIKNGEKDLIDAVKDDLDLIAVKEILQKKLKAAALSSTGGEIVVHNNEIAFRLDFDLNLSGSLMFDRQGNYIAETVDDETEESKEQEVPLTDDLSLDDIDLDAPIENAGPLAVEEEPVNAEAPIDNASDTNDLNEEELDIGLPEYDLADEPDSGEGAEELIVDDSEPLPDDPESDPENDDINDILKESQDFWEQKNDS